MLECGPSSKLEVEKYCYSPVLTSLLHPTRHLHPAESHLSRDWSTTSLTWMHSWTSSWRTSFSLVSNDPAFSHHLPFCVLVGGGISALTEVLGMMGSGTTTPVCFRI